MGRPIFSWDADDGVPEQLERDASTHEAQLHAANEDNFPAEQNLQQETLPQFGEARFVGRSALEEEDWKAMCGREWGVLQPSDACTWAGTWEKCLNGAGLSLCSCTGRCAAHASGSEHLTWCVRPRQRNLLEREARLCVTMWRWSPGTRRKDGVKKGSADGAAAWVWRVHRCCSSIQARWCSTRGQDLSHLDFLCKIAVAKQFRMRFSLFYPCTQAIEAPPA
jgi:hypothetical protein